MDDTKKPCRICGNTLSKGGHRMDTYVGCTSLEQMLSYCTKANINPRDGAPYVLCSKCKHNLVIAYELILLYYKTAKRWESLTKLKAQDSTIKDPIDVAKQPEQDQNFPSFENIEPPEYVVEKRVFLAHVSVQENLPSEVTSPHRCAECEETFTCRDQLQEHRETCIPSGRLSEPPSKCCGCKAEFENRALLKAHSDSVHKPAHANDPLAAVDQIRFICDICYRRYKSRSMLNDHQQRPYRSKKRYQCASCGKSFRDKCSLDDHERVHANKQPFMCKLCSKPFARKESYRKHLRLHTVEKDRFKCDVCGKGFRTRGNLKDHYITHTAADRPLQCPRCSSRFTRKSCLKSHMRLHTGERPYKCDQCDAQYTFSSDLRRHVMAHKGIKPFACDICSRAYPRKDYLAKHVAASHPQTNSAGDL